MPMASAIHYRVSMTTQRFYVRPNLSNNKMAPRKLLTEKNKQYCRNYREKNKDKYRQEDRERKVRQRLRMKLLEPAKYKVKQEEDRARKRLERARKKKAVLEEQEQDQDHNANCQPEEPNTSFTHWATKNGSLIKAQQALPKSPRKRKKIIGSLVNKFNLQPQPQMETLTVFLLTHFNSTLTCFQC